MLSRVDDLCYLYEYKYEYSNESEGTLFFNKNEKKILKNKEIFSFLYTKKKKSPSYYTIL
jgi:hypothetical protein